MPAESFTGPTVAALSTPAAPAGLGVVRVSGRDAVAVASRVFRPASPSRSLDSLSGYTAAYGHVTDEEGDIDECVALVFRAPHSYTGEDVVEFSCHGGPYLLSRVLRALFAAGARPAGPGEFTRRAFLNGKLDLTGAEAVMGLIAADGQLAARTALAAREGAVFHRIQEVTRSLVEAQAAFSAYVDYPDDDIPELEPTALAAVLEQAGRVLSQLLSTFDAGRILREGVDTAIVGSPSVGKSTLMNLLAGCERSIVTPAAGTTRDIVEETVRLGNVTLRLADTAGIRDAADAAEAAGVERARKRLRSAALVLAVFDGSRPLEEGDLALLRELPASSIVLLNKSDRPFVLDAGEIRRMVPRVVCISASTGQGLQDLVREVEDITGVCRLNGGEPVLATERQRDAVRLALDGIGQASAALAEGLTLDVVSVCVDSALGALMELTGERVTEAVVEDIFSRFCVGK